MNPDASYFSLITYLFSVNRHSGCRLGLSTMQRINQLLGSPDRSFISIQVAGSNGKGSVTTKVARALQLSGYKTGCYTSPHLASFRERIQVNGINISEAEVERDLKVVIDMVRREGLPATFFELTTALAFFYFARSGVRVAVLETGLGGRLDATNIVSPVLSVITSISLEHTDILGTTCDAIAREKGGIIKPDVPVVLGPTADLPPIRKSALEKSSPLVVVAKVDGDFDEENSAIARVVLEQLSAIIPVTPEAICQAIQSRPPCRFECVPEGVLQKSRLAILPIDIVLDVAHNPGAMLRLSEALETRFFDRSLHIVCGFSKDKDVVGCLKILSPQAASFAFIQANHERSIPAQVLVQLANDAKIHADQISGWNSISRALDHSIQAARASGGVVVVCGSFFIMAEVRACLGYIDPQDGFNLNENLTGLDS